MTTIDHRGRRHRARLAVVVLALLLGLIGMHALSLHGANTGSTASPAADYGTHTASHVSPDVDHGIDHATSDDGVGDHGGHSGHGSGAMLMICLAVLAATLSLLWPALARGVGHIQFLRLTPTRIAPLRSLRLGTGPPPVWQFSVIRC